LFILTIEFGRFVAVARESPGVGYSGTFDPILAVVEGSINVKNKVKENGYSLIPIGSIIVWMGSVQRRKWNSESNCEFSIRCSCLHYEIIIIQLFSQFIYENTPSRV
jgi:hypothetical protein